MVTLEKFINRFMNAKAIQLLKAKAPGHSLAVFIGCLLLSMCRVQASVSGWGTNDYGQLTIPSNLTGARSIASGYWHGLAVTSSNTVVGWGLDDLGQADAPSGLTGVSAVAAGDSHSLALTTNGSVAGWGVKSTDYNPNPNLNFYFGQADIPSGLTNVTAIAAGAFHSMALKSDGTVQAWGYDFYHQCDVPDGLTNAVAIACGGYFSVALKNDGTVVAWGDNYYGQTNLPPDLTNVVAIAAGGLHGLALKSDGTVEGWGARGASDFTQDFGQENAPTDLTNVISIAAGFFHSLALKSDGTVRQWGDNSLGQTNPPASLSGVSAIAGGYAHSFALISDQVVFLTQPTNVVTITNRAVSFAATVSGTTPLRETWWRSIINTNGTTTNSILGSVVFSGTPIGTSFVGCNTHVAYLTNQPGIQFALNLLANYQSLTNAGTNASFYVVITNALGAVTSSVATLTVMLPPAITNQPANVTTNPGATVFFTVGASGGQPLGYQWFFISGGQTNPISAGQTNVLELDNVSPNDAGNYQVLVTNAVGSVTSFAAALSVDGSPAITTQPINTSVVIGSNATFNVAVSGADPLTFQWYFYQTNYMVANQTNVQLTDFTALPDGTSANYTVFNAQTTNTGYYFLVASNAFNIATSSVVTLTVLTPPLILTQPANMVTLTNKAVSCAVQASGATPLRATWWRATVSTNGVITYSNMASVNFSNGLVTTGFTGTGGGNVQGNFVTNQPTAQFTLNLFATYSGLTNAFTNSSFYVVITNALGSVTSSVATLTVMLPPKVTNQPVNVSSYPGATVVFSVGASGSQPLGYQWFFISGGLTNLVSVTQTNALELDNVSTNDAGSYQVVVTNAVGSATSIVATLSVDGSPAIILQPTNKSVIIGSNATFTAIARGSGALFFQWYFQSNALSGEVFSSYTVTGAQATNAGNYFLVVSSDIGSVTSSVVTLTVLTPPVLLTQPTNVVTVTNKAVSFVVQASGAAPLRATWWTHSLTNGVPINVNLGSVNFSNITTTASFTGGNVQGGFVTNQPAAQFTLNLQATYSALTNAGSNAFFVVITNSLGSVTSSVATLTVLLPPAITSQPVSVATNPASTAFFTVGASGSQPLGYQWLFISGGQTNLVGAGQANVLELDNVSTNDAGKYQVLVTNAAGSATSSLAKLTILVNGSFTPPQLWLLNHDLNGDGIMIALEAGRNYRVQSSADLSQWVDITNFLSQSSLIVFTNSLLTNVSSQYYRVVTP
jgi:hypothetical protein